MASRPKKDYRLEIEQNILNYCISGDLKSLKDNAHLVGLAVHKNSVDGQTCLIAACRNGHLDVAEYLIDVHGADVEQVGVVEFEGEQIEGVPPLWCAAAAGHLKLVEFLVSRGADVNQTTITNSTALRAACFDGHEQVVRFLVEHGANIENPNRHGHTCLMISCYRRHERIVEYLLSKKARVNRRSSKGNTALHDCAESGNLISLQLLLNYGAIMRKDEYGQSPIMSGANAAFRKIVEYLANYGDSTAANSNSNLSTISVYEKAAAYDLLGASLFDRHSLVQDAIASWYYAMELRERANCFAKFIPPILPTCNCQSISQSNNLHELNNQTVTVTKTSDTINSSIDIDWNCTNSITPNKYIHFNDTLHTDSTEPYILVDYQNNIIKNDCDQNNLEQHNLIESNSKHNIYEYKQNQLKEKLQLLYLEKFKQIRNSIKESQLLMNYTNRTYNYYHNNYYYNLINNHQNNKNKSATTSMDSINNSPNNLSTMFSFSNSSSSPSSTTTTVSTNSSLIQPSMTLADPILGIEPKCLKIAHYYRWPLDINNLNFPNYKKFQETFDSFDSSYFAQCSICHTILIPYQISKSILNNSTKQFKLDCPICKQKILSTTATKMNDCRQNSVSSSTKRVRIERSMIRTNTKVVQPIMKDKDTDSFICPHCNLALSNHPLILRLKQCGEEAFGRVTEFRTHEELANLMQNTHALRLQPLLIRLRILGPDHPDTIYFIRYRGAIYADSDNFRQCLNLWKYALELQRIFLEPLCHVSQAAFVSFAELFHLILTNNYAGLPALDLDPTLIVDCLELAMDNIERGMDYSFYHWHRRHPWSYTAADKEAINLMRHVALCLHFIAMILIHFIPNKKALPRINKPLRRSINSYEDIINENYEKINSIYSSDLLSSSTASTSQTSCLTNEINQSNLQISDTNSDSQTQVNNLAAKMEKRMPPMLRDRFYRQVHRLVKLDPRVHRGQNLIHLACSPETSTVGRCAICHFPNVNVLSLLFELGADANCPDVDGQRPIGHILNHRLLKSSDYASLLPTLLKGGAHLDASNRNSQTILLNRFSHVLLESHIRVLDHVTLACQAARVAIKAGFTSRHSFVRNYLPEHLLSFLEMHQ